MESYKKQKKLAQVQKDFIKFIPFSFFILIAGGEIFLPAWVLIFPNSVPSQFVADEEREKKFLEMKELQERSAKNLRLSYPRYL